jgi:hypothetical protein
MPIALHASGSITFSLVVGRSQQCEDKVNWHADLQITLRAPDIVDLATPRSTFG